MENILTKLCACTTVSGNELENFQLIKKLLPENTLLESDNNGNIVATLGNSNGDNIILLDAHNDQIGFIVTYIDEKGFIKVSNCGGIDRRVLLGSVVTVKGKYDIKGIICCLPPHLSDGGEDKAPSADSVYIDTGLSKEDVTALVSLGDRVVINATPKKLLGTRFTGVGLDNKAGVATIIKVAHLLSNEELNCCVKLLFSCQEETGFLGSKTASFSISPKCAIVVDVSFATQPSVPSEKCGVMSKGPMIGIAPILNKDIFAYLKNIAENNNIPYQIEVMNSTTGTNADAITISKGGVPTGLVSIPLRNMHTQAEVVDMQDIDNSAQLIATFIKERGAL